MVSSCLYWLESDANLSSCCRFWKSSSFFKFIEPSPQIYANNRESNIYAHSIKFGISGL